MELDKRDASHPAPVFADNALRLVLRPSDSAPMPFPGCFLAKTELSFAVTTRHREFLFYRQCCLSDADIPAPQYVLVPVDYACVVYALHTPTNCDLHQ